MRIAIASGKGGTGKTTLAANIYHHLHQTVPSNVLLVDCDVEEPNALQFFPDAVQAEVSPVHQEIPEIDTSKCTFCRKCVDYCEFNAILVMPAVNFAGVNANLCHSCGACMVACDQEAIWVRENPIGSINRYSTGYGKGIIEGVLKIGSTMQTMVIRELKKSLPPNIDFFIFDAPPGTSCPVVECISDTDYVILVTEPTPFGLYDLKLMVDLVRELEIQFGVVINKAGLGNREVYDYLDHEGIEILGEIPFSRSYAAQYAKGEIFTDIPAQISESYSRLVECITGYATRV